MCNQCWLVVKDTYTFMKTCFKTEVTLRTLFRTNGRVLSDREILDMIYKENNVEHSQNTSSKNVDKNIAVCSKIRDREVKENQNKEISEFSMELELEEASINTITQIAMFTNESNKIETQQTAKNSQSTLTISDIDSNICEIKPDDIRGLEFKEDFEDIFEEKLHDGNVVEIRIRNRNSIHGAGWTEKIDEFSCFSEDNRAEDIVDNDNNFGISSSADITDSATETNRHTVQQSVPTQQQTSGAANVTPAILKKQLKVNVTDCIKYPSNPLRTASVVHKEMSVLRVNLVDCIKHQLSQDGQKIIKNVVRSSRKHKIKHQFKSSIPKVSVQTVLKKRIRCAECNFVTSEEQLMNAHMDKHIRESETENKCQNCQFESDNRDELLRHSSSCQINLEIPKKSITRNERKNKSVYTSEKNIGDHLIPNKTTHLIAKSDENKITTVNPSKLNKATRPTLKSRKNKSAAVTSKKSKEKQKEYICDICQKGFTWSANFYRHKRTHSDVRNIICDVCGKRFKSKAEMRIHLVVHSTELKFYCDICKKGFKIKSTLKTHIFETHSSDRNFNCNICKKGFKSKSQLKFHLFVHSSDRKYICDICQKAFKTPRHKYKHTKYVHGIELKAFCGICQKGFKNSDRLRRHRLTHLDERNFVCDICQKSFKCPGSLYQHKLIHFQKKFICDVCRKSFHTSGNLRRHKETVHNTEKTFICDVCRKGFKSNWCLKLHQAIHREAREFMCNVCQKGFKTLGNLNGHKLVHDSARKYVCNICQKTFKQMSVLKQHLSTHTDDRRFVCETCQKGFKTSTNLYRHKQENCYGRQFICRVCFKAFRKRSTLERHRNAACGETIVICYDCQKGFKSKLELIEHLTVHSKRK